MSSVLPFLIVMLTVPVQALLALTPLGTLILPLTTIFTLPPLIFAVAPLPSPVSVNVGSGRVSARRSGWVVTGLVIGTTTGGAGGAGMKLAALVSASLPLSPPIAPSVALGEADRVPLLRGERAVGVVVEELHAVGRVEHEARGPGGEDGAAGVVDVGRPGVRERRARVSLPISNQSVVCQPSRV